jgi:hypothetical protein
VSTDTTLAAAAERFARVERFLSSDLTPMAVEIAKESKTAALQVAQAVTGSGRLSHMGRRGVRLGAVYTIEEQGRRIWIKFVPPGAWVIMDTGAKPHEEPRKRRGTRSGRGKRKGAMFGSGLAHPLTHVEHPGVRGRRALMLAGERIDKVVGPAGDRYVQGELRKIFG